MKTPLSGAFPVLPTPFRSNGAIDETDFIAIIRFALGSAVDGVVYPGVASEVDTLSEEERRSQVDLLGQARSGARFRSSSARAIPIPSVAARHVAHAAEIGAAAAMVMAPGHLGNSIEAQTEYFQQVAADAGVPIMLQNQPKPIGAGLTPEEVAAVASAVDDDPLHQGGDAALRPAPHAHQECGGRLRRCDLRRRRRALRDG